MGNGSHGRRNPYSVEVSGSVRPATIFFPANAKRILFKLIYSRVTVTSRSSFSRLSVLYPDLDPECSFQFLVRLNGNHAA